MSELSKKSKRACRPSVPAKELSLRRYLPAFLLLLLAEEESYGRQLYQKLKRWVGPHLLPEPDAVYRELIAMEARGEVMSRISPSPEGPARRIYRITPSGMEALFVWQQRIEERQAAFSELLRRCQQLKTGGIAQETS